MSDASTALVPTNLGPGSISTGFAERILAQSLAITDPAILWDGATTLAALAQKWNGHGAEKNEIKSAQMFVEIEIGQRLGPNPGDAGKGSWATNESPHAETDIPYGRIEEFRRYFGHRDWLLERVRDGKRSRRSLLLALERYLADDSVSIADVQIRRADFRAAFPDVESGSVTLILTDPPYPREYLALWSDLGRFAADRLVQGGSLVAYCGQSILPDVLDRLRVDLRYWWTLAILHDYGTAMIPGKWVSAGWKPAVWFVRERRLNRSMLADRIDGSSPRKTVPVGDDGSWGQGVEELEGIISALSEPGDLIVDPFAGSGTVGLAALRFRRRFIGADLGAVE